MLGRYPVTAIVPTRDVGASRRFYEDKLGLKVVEEQPMDAVLFEAGDGTRLLLYTTHVNVPAEHTVCSFEVDDIEATVTDLESRGVTLEDYDLAEFGFEGAGRGKIIGMPGDFGRGAWFKDPEGNILAVVQRTR